MHTIAKITATAAVTLAAGLSLTACGTAAKAPTPSTSACKSAMTQAYANALTDPSAKPATRPAACKGIPDATLRQFAGDTMATPAATTTPAAMEAAPIAAPAGPDATSTLTSDGYTLTVIEDKAAIATKFGAAAPYVTSAAGGTTGTSDALSIEVVVIVSPSGVQAIGGTTTTATTAMQAQVPAGQTVTVTGAPDGSDVIRVTGPASTF